MTGRMPNRNRRTRQKRNDGLKERRRLAATVANVHEPSLTTPAPSVIVPPIIGQAARFDANNTPGYTPSVVPDPTPPKDPIEASNDDDATEAYMSSGSDSASDSDAPSQGSARTIDLTDDDSRGID